MNDFPTLQPLPLFRAKSRSMGLKLVVVCALALLMTIPSFFVDGLVNDRTRSGQAVAREISSHVGGQANLPRTHTCHPLHDLAAITIGYAEARHLSRLSCTSLCCGQDCDRRAAPVSLQGPRISGRSETRCNLRPYRCTFRGSARRAIGLGQGRNHRGSHRRPRSDGRRHVNDRWEDSHTRPGQDRGELYRWVRSERAAKAVSLWRNDRRHCQAGCAISYNIDIAILRR